MKLKNCIMLLLVLSFSTIMAVLATTPEDLDTRTRIRYNNFTMALMTQVNGTYGDQLGDGDISLYDVNGDGIQDLILGGDGKNLSGGTGDTTGRIYVMYGSSEKWSRSSYSVANANLTFNGTSPGFFGYNVIMSHINNDSYLDLVAPAYAINLSGGEKDYTGQVYVFYGSSDGLHSTAAANANVTINGTSPGYFRSEIIQDLNNDSKMDLVATAYGKNLSGGAMDSTGQVYIFYGGSDGLHSGTANDANVTINGTYQSVLGLRVILFDVNSDGYSDITTSAVYKNLSGGEKDYTGQVYVFYRPSDGLFKGVTANEANLTFNGTSPGYFGYGLNYSDFNNDGNLDLLVAAPDVNLSGGEKDSTGQVYIFYGSSDGLHSTAAANANVTFNGTSPGRFGRHNFPLPSADFNKDGYQDLILAASYKNLSGGVMDSTGQAYLFLGSATGFNSGTISTANITLNSTGKGDYYGVHIEAADVNEDNITEILIGAWSADIEGSGIDGAVYIYTFNFPPTYSTIPNQGWNEDSSITINLSQYFSDVNRDNLNYTWTGNTNIAISIDEATNIVTLTPNANWYGTEYIMFYANDSYNDLVASNNITLIVSNTADCGDNTCDPSESCSSCASDCGACPAVSGSSSTIAEPKAAHTFTTVTPEKPAIADFKNMAVSSITLTTDETANNVRLEVKEISQTNVAMPEAGVYKLIDIKASNIELKEAKIKFKVKLSWLKENEVEQGEVVLMHHKDSWKKLETAYTGKDDENAYYEAKTGSLSMFAIIYEKKEDIKEDEVIEEPNQEEKKETLIVPVTPVKEKSVFSPIVFSAIAALIVISVILIFINKKRKE